MLAQQEKKSTLAFGLTKEEIADSYRKYGKNVFTKQKKKGFWKHFFENLNDPVIKILLGALCINLLLSLVRKGDLQESVGIGVAVLLATLISTVSECGSEKAFERLSEVGSKLRCRVIREGSVFEISASDLAVGDLVLLSPGDAIPADGHLLEGTLRTDQSAMTGENREIEKVGGETYDKDPASLTSLFRGCNVTGGKGIMRVLAVGDRTFLGEISKEIQEETRTSPLKIRLTKLAKQISVIGYAAAIAVTAVSLLNRFLFHAADVSPQWSFILGEILSSFTLGLTVLVVAVPEGLPMMIAVVLSSNTKKMIRDRVLVRKSVGLESAGSMNILFTDKTGTLTEGNMRVSRLILHDGNEKSVKELLKFGGSVADLYPLFCHFGCNCSVGKDESGKETAVGGSATERALLLSVLSRPFPKGYARISESVFDSEKKFSAVTLSGKRRVTLVMGAAEKILPHTSGALSETGETVRFNGAAFEKKIEQISKSGERIMVLAISESASASAMQKEIRAPLSFVCAVSIADRLRGEAPLSVKSLQSAGIHTVMITGDNPETAKAVARACGILNPANDVILSGSELAKISDQKIKELLPRLAVVARALPTDKSRLVRIAQEEHMVVGMTGDGINDAPALRRADVGFAMGDGTQVAKDAGDVVILDNNLASVVKAVLYGRNIFKSIRKFITLQLLMNFCAVCVTVIGPFIGFDSPVTVVQMLWINLIMDTLGGLAFAGEVPLPECMKEPPKAREESILNRYMVNEILLQGGFTVALFLTFLKHPAITALFRETENHLCLLTAFFALFIFSSVFNCFNARTDRLKLSAGLSENKIFILIMSAILVIQILFVYLGGSVLRTMPLLPRELSYTMLFSLSVFPADFLRKWVWKKFRKRGGY